MKNKEKISYQAKAITRLCFRDTILEDFHSGISPVSVSGDYSDVTVTDGEGNTIPWNQLSRINDEEMKLLMKEAVNLVYSYLQNIDNPKLHTAIEVYLGSLKEWSEPEEIQELGMLIKMYGSKKL